MSHEEVLIQQLILGLSNGLIIALIALGYSIVYGIVEIVNFAHGDVFMLGAFFSISMLNLCIGEDAASLSLFKLLTLLLITGLFTALLNFTVNKLAYKPLRNSQKLAPLVSAIGVSFILMNIGLFWGNLPIKPFAYGRSPAAPKNYPDLIGSTNLLNSENIIFSGKDLLIFTSVIPILLILTFFIKKTKYGKAMRAVAQDPVAASIVGIDSERVISISFIIGGFLAGIASIIYSTYNETISYQMGFKVGLDAFTAAVIGGIGSLPGAFIGSILIGLTRALSDQYLESQWTNVIVFSLLIIVLIFFPSGMLGKQKRVKV